MSSIRFRKYLVEGGPVLEAFAAFEAKLEAVRAKWKVMTGQFGATGVALHGNTPEGLIFDDGAKAPDGWKAKPMGERKYYYVPSQRSKQGRALLQEWRQWRSPTWETFQSLVPGTWSLMWTGDGAQGRSFSFRIWTLMCERLGGSVVLHVPDVEMNDRDAKSLPSRSGHWVPPGGCRLLKESEYHLLKEQANAEGGAA